MGFFQWKRKKLLRFFDFSFFPPFSYTSPFSHSPFYRIHYYFFGHGSRSGGERKVLGPARLKPFSPDWPLSVAHQPVDNQVVPVCSSVVIPAECLSLFLSHTAIWYGRELPIGHHRKMKIKWIKVLLLVVVFAIGAMAGSDRHDMMRNAMEHMLGIRPPPNHASGRFKRQDSTSESSLHYYMMQLYQKYLTSDSMKSRSNTIRSIIPLKGKHQPVYFYNSFFSKIKRERERDGKEFFCEVDGVWHIWPRMLRALCVKLRVAGWLFFCSTTKKKRRKIEKTQSSAGCNDRHNQRDLSLFHPVREGANTMGKTNTFLVPKTKRFLSNPSVQQRAIDRNI